MKAYTDINQSKKLAEILPLESADHHYVRKIQDSMGKPVDGKWSTPKYGNPNTSHANYMVMGFTNYEIIPCWSLAALLELLDYPQLSKDKLGSGKKGWMVSVYPDNCRYDSCWHDNSIDTCYEMILKLHELNLL